MGKLVPGSMCLSGDEMRGPDGARMAIEYSEEPGCQIKLYDGDRIVWASGAYQRNASHTECMLLMQQNGNLVLFAISPSHSDSSSRLVAWASGVSDATHAQLKKKPGIGVFMNVYSDDARKVLWTSRTKQQLRDQATRGQRGSSSENG